MREDPGTITLVENDTVALWYHPKEKIVHHQIRQFVYGEQFRQLLTRGVDLFIEKSACKWLSDDRGHSALTPEDTEWGQTVWTPKVLAAGWKFWAVVMPASKLGQLNSRRFVKMYGDMGVTVRTFTDAGEAFGWLSEQK